MKWIGQQIYDQVSRFRHDFYLEGIATSTETDMLVVDSAGKVSKRAIDAITVDVSDFMTNGVNNRVLTATGADAINAEANLTFDGSTLSVEADSNTTANALFIDANSLTTGSAISIDVDDALTVSNTKSLAKIHYDKSGVMGAGQAGVVTGLEIALNDDATNHALATSTLKGIDVKIDYDNATGNQKPIGVKIEVAKDGVVSDNNNAIGWETTVNDAGGLDFKCFSSANDHVLTGDFSSWATIANGATTITTHDHSGTAAHLEIAADGDITLDSAGQIKLEPVAGNDILLAGTISVDAGVVTGATSITSTAFVGTLSTAAQPNVTTLAGLTSFGAAGATTDIAAGDLTMYNPVNNGNPTISLGKDASDRFEIKTAYNSGAQTIDEVYFSTYTTSGTTNDGRYIWEVDEVELARMLDVGLVVSGIISANDNGAFFSTKNTSASSATEGGQLNLVCDDGAAMGDDHRLGVIEFQGAEDASSTYVAGAKIQAMCDAAWSASENGTRLEFYTMDGNAASELSLTLDSNLLATFAGAVTSTGTLTTGGTIELGHASDTTLARSAAGKVTIEGNQIVTAGATTVASATQVPIGMQIARRTITQAEMNDLHNTPIAIIPALGANLVAIPVNGTIFVDRAANQTANAQLMIGYGSSAFNYSIYVFKRFHYNISTDFHYGMDMYVGQFGTSMTAGVNTAINASANAAYTNNAFTSVDVYINYYVIDRS